MQIQVHYQGLDSSEWADDFIKNRVTKLSRYLDQSATIQVNLKLENRKYLSTLVIHNVGNDYAFTSSGDNLYESFALAVDKGGRSLGEHKRMLKDKINRRYIPLKQAVA
jgi:ribosomal subunit interface protein